MSNIFGDNVKMSIFGQSHSPAIGVTIDGLPAGMTIDFEELYTFLERRAPGRHKFSTTRKEEDMPEFISGIVNGKTCGAAVTAIIRNHNTRSQDYANLRDVPRPGHADFTAYVKFKGYNDIAGGGQFSGRLTAPLCIAGGITKQFLKKEGIEVTAHIRAISDVNDDAYPLLGPFEDVSKKEMAVINDEALMKMKEAIEQARMSLDSLGGVIECAVYGLPAGIGGPMFDGVENAISRAVFAIPAVKGIEFGRGFECAKLRGSENNDEFYVDHGAIKTKTNNHGGILGGITSGMPVIFRVAIKPTSSIARKQDSVSLSKMQNEVLQIKGRHDPCIVPRAVPCVEAAAAFAIYDAMLSMR